jgi:hypothetical protein
MATDAIVTAVGPVYRPVNRTLEHVFFTGMALLMCLCVYIGFGPTYFRAGLVHAPLFSPILHVHGALFTLWMLLFTVQAVLVTAHRVQLHRTLGTIFFCLPPIMIVLGVMAAVAALRHGVRIGPLDPAVSFAIPMIGLTGFVPVIYAAWVTKRKPDTHKRLILIATAGLVEAAFGRFPWAQFGVPPAAGALTGLGALLLMLVLYDLIALRRIHRATMWALPLTFAVNAAAVPIGMTAWWHSLAAAIK